MYCNNCGSEIPNTAKFCQNCGYKIGEEITTQEDVKDVEIEIEDNDTCLLESKKVNYGFGQGELYAYNNRLEYINKKGVKTICYFNEIKEVTTLGKVFTLVSKNIKSYSFGVIDGDALEWIKFVKDKVEKSNQKYLDDIKQYDELIIELINQWGTNRFKVVQEFAVRTGIGMGEGRQIVDRVYNEKLKPDMMSNPFTKKMVQKQEEKARVEQLQKDKIPYCPKCHSTSLSANKKGFGFVKGALAGGLTKGIDVGMIVGGAGANKIVLTCMNCGHQFKPRKKINKKS